LGVQAYLVADESDLKHWQAGRLAPVA
jgi:hypothetical protein